MRQRVVTALLLAIPALLALASRSPVWLFTLGLAASLIGGLEADRLLNVPRPVIGVLSVVLFGFFASPLLAYHGRATEALVMLLVSATLIGIAAASVPESMPSRSLLRSFGGLWIAAPLMAILALHRSASGFGQWCVSPALMALVPVWAGDIAAIFAGKAFGKHLLAPSISPKKTVEGSVANLLAAILVAWLLGRLLHLDDVRSLGAGLAVGLLGQAGDLFESWLKRRAGVKDSGTLLPGHGGVLDRIDSVLFAAPAVALILLN